MAYTFQPLDEALDSLGISYIDGVTVKVADKYKVNCDLKDVENLLKTTDPKLSCLQSEYDTGFEKKVLADLESYEKNRDIKRQHRAKRIAEYEKRREEEEERKRIEEEKRKEEEERRRIEEEKKKKEEEERLRLEEEERIKEEKEKERRKKEEDEKNALEDERLRLLEIENARKAEKSKQSALVTSVEDPPERVALPEPASKAIGDEDHEWRQFEEHRRQEMEWQQFERERAASTESNGDLAAAASSVNFNSTAAKVNNDPAAVHNSGITLQCDIQKSVIMSQMSPITTVKPAPTPGQGQAGNTGQGQGQAVNTGQIQASNTGQGAADGQSSQNNTSVINVMKPFKPTSNFNFKDFEAESDVFADMELKTINEMAELRSILGASATNKVLPQPTGHSTAAPQFQVPPGQIRPGAYTFQNNAAFSATSGSVRLPNGQLSYPSAGPNTGSGFPQRATTISSSSQQYPAYNNMYGAGGGVEGYPGYRQQGYPAAISTAGYSSSVSMAGYQAARYQSNITSGYPSTMVSTAGYQSSSSLAGYPPAASIAGYQPTASVAGYQPSASSVSGYPAVLSSTGYQAPVSSSTYSYNTSQANNTTQLISSTGLRYPNSMVNPSPANSVNMMSTSSSLQRTSPAGSSIIPGPRLPGGAGNSQQPTTYSQNMYTHSIHSVQPSSFSQTSSSHGLTGSRQNPLSSQQHHNGYPSSNPTYHSNTPSYPSTNLPYPKTNTPSQPPLGMPSYSTRLGVSTERGTSRSKSTDRGSVDVSPESSEESPPAAGQLKPSRSVGDILFQLQEEARSIAEHKRKQMQTPPPPGVSTNKGPGMEDWIPWPEMDQDKQQKRKKEESVLQGLGDEEVNLCRQLGEMGFPMARLAKAARCHGADSQKLLNFCVSVDKLVEHGFKEDACLETVALYHQDQNKSRKHLEGFSKLSELGFDPSQVHGALHNSEQDYQKALDILIS